MIASQRLSIKRKWFQVLTFFFPLSLFFSGVCPKIGPSKAVTDFPFIADYYLRSLSRNKLNIYELVEKFGHA